MRYLIHESNIERLERKVKAVSNKCKKYGCDFHYQVVGEEFKEVNVEGRNQVARFVVVEAEGKAIVNGWEFVAKVQHTDNGNIITGVGIEVPEKYYTSKPVCEHCNSKRTRKYTYIVRNTETGEFKQVGKSCLKDFVGGYDIGWIAQYISMFEELIVGEAPMPGSSYKAYIETEEYLRYAAETIKHFGFHKADTGEYSTLCKALTYYNVDHGNLTGKMAEPYREEMAKVNFDANSEYAKQVVAEAIQWITGRDEQNNYYHNLKVAVANQYIVGNVYGILASLIAAYNKAMEIKAKREKAVEAEINSQYVGELKQRITATIKSIKCVTSWDTDFGYTYVYKIIGQDGNTYTWKTGKGVDEEQAIGHPITGTVKAHTEFRGIKQTELTRCKIR